MEIRLEKNPVFKEAMKELGFKKDRRNVFYRFRGEAKQTVRVTRSHHGEPGISYYAGFFFWEYPVVTELIFSLFEVEKKFVANGLFGHHLGYAMPENSFVEWRIANDCTEEYLEQTIHTIIDAFKKYAIPIMDRYVHLSTLIDDIKYMDIPKCVQYDKRIVSFVEEHHLINQSEQELL